MGEVYGISVLQRHYARLRELLGRLDAAGADEQARIKREVRGLLFDQREETDLHDADPACEHDVGAAPGGGVKCRKCRGWFCY